MQLIINNKITKIILRKYLISEIYRKQVDLHMRAQEAAFSFKNVGKHWSTLL